MLSLHTGLNSDTWVKCLKIFLFWYSSSKASRKYYVSIKYSVCNSSPPELGGLLGRKWNNLSFQTPDPALMHADESWASIGCILSVLMCWAS